MGYRGIIITALLGSALACPQPEASAQSLSASVPTQLSVAPGPIQANGRSDDLVLSPNSGIAAFASGANNLVPGDTNGFSDIFVRAANGTISRESVSSTGQESDSYSISPSISQVTASGAYAIAFVSRASNLVPGLAGEELEYDQVYLRLPHIKKTILVSRGYTGSAHVGGVGFSIHPQVVALDSADSFLVAFESTAFNIVPNAVPPPDPSGRRLKRIFFATVTVKGGEASVTDMGAMIGLKGVQADGDLQDPVLSGYGDKMLFRTDAKNLGWPNPDGVFHVALAIKGGGITLISKGPTDGLPGDRFSDSHALNFSGTMVFFRTHASNIFEATPNNPSLVAFSTETKKYNLVNTNSSGVRGNSVVHDGVKVDPRGRLVAFTDLSDNYLAPGVDTNNRDDIFVKDLETNQIVRVNLGAGGVQETDGYVGGVCIGTLGYSSQVSTVGFYSSSSILRQVGSGQDAEVYRSLLTLSAPPLTTTTKLQTPPDVAPGVKKLVLTFQRFGSVASGSSISDVESMATNVTYEAQLTNKGSKKKLKVVSNRNRVVLRNLTPGQYTVRYRVSGTTSRGKKVTTKYSPSVSVTVRAR